MTYIANRLPSLHQTLAVYGIIVLIIYGWTTYWILWKFPSWLYFMQGGEILAVVLYALTTNLLESLCVLALPVGISFVLPSRWFRDAFVARGSALVICVLLVFIYFAKQIYRLGDVYPRDLIRLLPEIALAIAALVFVIGRIGILRALLEALADRATIFSYLTLFLSTISMLIVIVRNIF